LQRLTGDALHHLGHDPTEPSRRIRQCAAGEPRARLDHAPDHGVPIRPKLGLIAEVLEQHAGTVRQHLENSDLGLVVPSKLWKVTRYGRFDLQAAVVFEQGYRQRHERLRG
jgi:hypothetical protein